MPDGVLVLAPSSSPEAGQVQHFALSQAPAFSQAEDMGYTCHGQQVFTKVATVGGRSSAVGGFPNAWDIWAQSALFLGDMHSFSMNLWSPMALRCLR